MEETRAAMVGLCVAAADGRQSDIRLLRRAPAPPKKHKQLGIPLSTSIGGHVLAVHP